MFKEYVGARYVPKLMGEWNKDLPYEPLSVVTYMGASYTSKIPVPAGIEIGNTTYWVCTGNYNAQIADYHDSTIRLTERYTEVSNSLASAQEDITSLESRMANEEQFSIKSGHGITILIGDSYLEGWTPERTVKSWGQFYADISGETINESLFIFYQGGAGFVNAVDNITFNTLLANAISDSRINNADVSKIIVVGGVNDAESDPLNALQNFMKSVKDNFVNATVYIGYNGAGATNRCSVYEKMYMLSRYERYSYLGYVYLDNIIASIQKKSLFSESDKFHLNENGQRAFAGAIYTSVHGGRISFDHENEFHNSNKLIVSASSDVITFYMYTLTTIPITESNSTCDGKSKNASIQFDSDIIWGRGYLIDSFPAAVKYKSGKFKECNVNFVITENEIEFRVILLNSDGTNWENTSNLAEILPNKHTFSMRYYLA